MSKNNSKTDTERQKIKVVDIGKLLCEARDNLGVSTEDISSELNLATEVISNIENNVFEQDIPSAFIRGYIKSYATKVGLDTSAILKEYDLQTVTPVPSIKRVKIISKFDIKRRDINSNNYLVKTLSALMIIIFISFAGWEIWKRYLVDIVNNNYSGQSNNRNNINEIALNTNELSLESNRKNNSVVSSNFDSTASTDINSKELNTANNKRLLDSQVNNNQIKEQSLTEDNNKNMTALSETHLESVLPEQLNMTQLVFDFSADCWVKITDSRGEVIALGVKVIDKHMAIEGVAPFNVILGDPSVVLMSVNGIEHDLSSYKNGKRAKFVIE